MIIEIEDRVAGLLQKLRAQAKANGMPFDAYLERFIHSDDQIGLNAVLSLSQLEQVLDELAAPPPDSSLPADFSRADIYADHN